MMNFGEPKKLFQSTSKPKEGSFANDAKNITWKGCRDQFAKLFNEDTKGFFFSYRPGSNEGDSVAAFIHRTEQILDLDEFSNFCKTTRNYAIWVSPSYFWKSHRMRRSLFTILLRAGRLYLPEKNNYDGVLMSEKYVRETKTAIHRFLYGFTDTTIPTPTNPDNSGWWSNFKENTTEDVRKKLILPKGKKKESSLINAGSLWG